MHTQHFTCDLLLLKVRWLMTGALCELTVVKAHAWTKMFPAQTSCSLSDWTATSYQPVLSDAQIHFTEWPCCQAPNNVSSWLWHSSMLRNVELSQGVCKYLRRGDGCMNKEHLWHSGNCRLTPVLTGCICTQNMHMCARYLVKSTRTSVSSHCSIMQDVPIQRQACGACM